MKNLIYKELKLIINPVFYFFACLGSLVLIPSWPYSMALLYVLFGLQSLFFLAASNKDCEFTSMLPLAKSAYVMSKHFVVVFLQLIQIAATIPFAILSSLVINPSGNPLSLDANFTLFGVALIGFSVFNIIFLPWFFKTGHKAGLPVLLGMIANALTVVAIEVIIAVVPILKANLDGLNPSTFGWQILALILGAGVYAGILFYSYKRSCKNFDKVNL